MKTDTLFYEIFRFDPRSLFRLARLDIEGEYVFGSINVKSTERRFDGFLRRTDGDGPNIFLEVQGYEDPKIYWRLFGEISMYHARKKSKEQAFHAIILFVDEKYDPRNCPIDFVHPNRLIRLYLPECLETLESKAGTFTVLKPLILSDMEKLPEIVPRWKSEIDSLKLPEYQTKILTDLLEHAILSRFPNLTLKEIRTMIQLTPLEKTVAGKELIRMTMRKGRKEGEKKGAERGKLIGKIHLAQQLLKRSPSSEPELFQKSMEELKSMCEQLQAELNLTANFETRR